MGTTNFSNLKLVTDFWCFHSINVPSEWGREHPELTDVPIQVVSIQLMSPASGDALSLFLNPKEVRNVSIQLMSPASGDSINVDPIIGLNISFPFN